MLKFDKKKQAGRFYKAREKAGYKGSEHDLQVQCEDYLDACLLPYIRIPDAIYKGIFATNAIKPYLKVLIAKFIKGVPDITVLFKNGRYLCVELKNANGKQTQWQKKFEKLVGEDNYRIIRDLETFIKEVRRVQNDS